MTKLPTNEEYYASIEAGERVNFIPPHARAMDEFKNLSLQDKLLSEDVSIEHYLSHIEEKYNDGKMNRDEYFQQKIGWEQRQIRLQSIMKKRYSIAPEGRGFFLEPDPDEGLWNG